jgi:glycine cleavage system H lipoate-binding protein
MKETGIKSKMMPPQILNSQPMDESRLAKVTVVNPSEIDDLISETEYAEYLNDPL